MGDHLAIIDGFFTENLGQVANPDVLYYAQGDPLSVAFTEDRVLYQLSTSIPGEDGGPFVPMARSKRITGFEMSIEGSNPVEPVGMGLRGHLTHVFKGDDPDKWVRGAHSFSQLLWRGIYEGIDLRFYFKDGMVKYDFILAPGADPGRILLGYHGIEGLRVDPTTGDLLIITELGTLRDMCPVIFQDTDDHGSGEGGGYVLMDDYQVTFEVPTDCSTQCQMVIDPGLVFSTYLGGSDTDRLFDVALDADGNIVVGGVTASPEFPTTKGVYDEVGNPDTNAWPYAGDMFITKLDPTGSSVIFSTFVAGGDDDTVLALEVLSNGEILAAGSTTSYNFPKVDAIQDGLAGLYDICWLRLTPSGNDLLFCTYWGGSGVEEARALEIDVNGDVFLSGITGSYDLWTSNDAFCRTRVYEEDLSGPYSGFCMKMDRTLKSVNACTYINGLSKSPDVTRGSAQHNNHCLDPEGNCYYATCVYSTKFYPPEKGGAYTTRSGTTDGLILKLDQNLSEVLAWSLYGGRRDEFIVCIEHDGNGSVLVTGGTNSTDIPTTPNAPFNSTRDGIHFDVMIGAFHENLSSMWFSTYYGGAFHEKGNAIAPGIDGTSVIVVVESASEGLWTPGCFDSVKRTPFGFQSTVVAVIDLHGKGVLYSTYYGGYGGLVLTERSSLEVCPNGDLIVGGSSDSSWLPISQGAFCSTYGGGDLDGFLFKLDPTPCGLPVDAPENLRVEATDDRYIRLRWDPPRVGESMVVGHRLYRGTSPDDLDHMYDVSWRVNFFEDKNVTNGVFYYYRVAAINSAGEGPKSGHVLTRALKVPSEPFNLGSWSGDGAAHINWTPPNDTGGEISGYIIHRAGVGGTPAHFDTVSNDKTTYDDYGVVPGDTYVYAVLAYNEKGSGPISDIIEVWANGPPSPPINPSVEEGDGQITLSWEHPELDGGHTITGYTIFKGTSVEDMEEIDDVGTGVLWYDDDDVTNGVTYYCQIKANNIMGSSPPSVAIPATPYGVPSEPRGLVFEVDDGIVKLSWSEPDSDGGRPITGYVIYFGKKYQGKYRTAIKRTERYTLLGLDNGVPYSFEVCAENLRGEGPCACLDGIIPIGPPGPPTNFTVGSSRDGVQLSWNEPSYFGGAESVSYRVMRGTSPMDLEPVVELEGIMAYLDTNVTVGQTYWYQIVSFNPLSEGTSTNPEPYLVSTVPGPVTHLVATRGNGNVSLVWRPPPFDGGDTVTGYFVLRRLAGGEPVKIGDMVEATGLLDEGLTNGLTYYYVVIAVNTVGEGDPSDEVRATPMPPPGAVVNFDLDETTNSIVLKWSPPAETDRAPVLGYRILKGNSREFLTELTMVEGLEYVDMDVGRDRVYWYSIVAISDVGPGETVVPKKGETVEPSISPGTLLILALLIVLVILASAAYVRRTGPEEGEGAVIDVTAEEHTLIVEDEGSPMAITEEDLVGEGPYIVEEVFVVYKDGRLLAHSAREEWKTQDADLMSGMLIAIEGLVQDGLERGGELESIKYGDNLIIMKGGSHVNLAVVVYGRSIGDVIEQMESAVARIENTYAGVIEDWSGDLSVLSGLEDLVAPLLEGTKEVSRDEIKDVAVLQGMSTLSSVDFHRGYVRLKVAVVNGTDSLVADASIDVHYNSEMLRLDRVEPETVGLKGDRAVLSNLRPEEKVTVAFLFDPQICQATYIDGTLTYYDTKGEVHNVELKRRHAEVVCPIFFTREHANTAMLKRLIKEELHISDLRVFKYPTSIEPSEVLELGKTVVGSNDIQLVREFVVEEPSYLAEVWFYGETKVKDQQMVMRLRTIEEDGLLEFFVASISMESITGLLAEFRRDLNRAFAERYSGEVGVKPDRNARTRMELTRRKLLIDTVETGVDG